MMCKRRQSASLASLHSFRPLAPLEQARTQSFQLLVLVRAQSFQLPPSRLARAHEVISSPRALGAQEDPVILAPRTLGTASSSMTWTRECYPWDWVPRTGAGALDEAG